MIPYNSECIFFYASRQLLELDLFLLEHSIAVRLGQDALVDSSSSSCSYSHFGARLDFDSASHTTDRPEPIFEYLVGEC
jgi:hypothetical protein